MSVSFSMMKETQLNEIENKRIRYFPILHSTDGRAWRVEEGQNINIIVEREGGTFTVTGRIECVDVENNFILLYPTCPNHSQPMCIKLNADNPNGVTTKNIIEDFSILTQEDNT